MKTQQCFTLKTLNSISRLNRWPLRLFLACLPKTSYRPHYTAGLVVNTDPRQKPGEHWIAMYFPDVRGNEFFDSYGFPPVYYNDDFPRYSKNRGDTVRNKKTLQALTSDFCGFYCIYYLYHRTRGHSLDSIVKTFRVKDRVGNDRYVERFVKQYRRIIVNVVKP